jgi:hypothetical protein
MVDCDHGRKASALLKKAHRAAQFFLQAACSDLTIEGESLSRRRFLTLLATIV